MNNFKKRIGAIFAALALLTVLPVSALAAGFTDVSPQSPYAEAIEWAVGQGITKGTKDTTFSPNQTCSNAQVLTFIWRACGQPEPTISNPFSDVSESNYFYKPALWAFETGLVEEGTFQPSKPCTRAMAVEYLWMVAGYPEASENSNFTDVDSESDYAYAVSWAVNAGITKGTNATTFSPDRTCTRAQIATFLYRYFR